MPSNNKNWQLWFGTRRWRVVDVSGTLTEQGCEVTFDHGSFTIAAPGAFQSVMSNNMGRTGVLVQEIDPVTGAVIDDALVAFGHSIIEQAREVFHAIV
jgi:hypothetical protein